MRVASVQLEPCYMDPAAGLEQIRTWTANASAEGATLVVFPELAIPGYPRYVPDPFPTSATGHQAWDDIVQYQRRYISEAQVIPGPITDSLGAIARQYGATLVVGLAEADPVVRGRMWNSLIVIDRDGSYVGKRRKTVAVMHERMYFDRGDVSDLRVFPTEEAVIGAAICFENHQPLVRRSLGRLGAQVHCALWTGPVTGADAAKGRITEKHREMAVAHALDNAMFAITSSQVTSKSPAPTPYGGNWPQSGGTYIVNPFGELLASVPDWEEGMAVADLDFDLIDEARLVWNPFAEDAREDMFGQLPAAPDATVAAPRAVPAAPRSVPAAPDTVTKAAESILETADQQN